jgi:hypothetical protein
LNQPARFQPIHQPRHVRRVAGQRFRQPAHRQRPFRLDEVQHVTRARREVEPAAGRRQMLPLREEELHEQLPRAARRRPDVVHGIGIILD